MDEKDLAINTLRIQLDALTDILRWMKEDGFGEEQFNEIMNAYRKDRRIN